jgi:hypothetical protein
LIWDNLRKEVKSVAQDKTPVSRYDLRVTPPFLKRHPAIATLFGIIMLAASWASFDGLLRWQHPAARYSFSALSLLVAVYSLSCARHQPDK